MESAYLSFHMKYLDLHSKENLIRQTSFRRKNTSQNPAFFRVKLNTILVINSNLYEIQTDPSFRFCFIKESTTWLYYKDFGQQSFICSKKRRIQCSYKSEHDIIASWHGLLRSLTNALAACQLACWETRYAHVKISSFRLVRCTVSETLQKKDSERCMFIV